MSKEAQNTETKTEEDKAREETLASVLALATGEGETFHVGEPTRPRERLKPGRHLINEAM